MRMTFSTPVTPTRESETSTDGRCDWTSGAEITTGGAAMGKTRVAPPGSRTLTGQVFLLSLTKAGSRPRPTGNIGSAPSRPSRGQLEEEQLHNGEWPLGNGWALQGRVGGGAHGR